MPRCALFCEPIEVVHVRRGDRKIKHSGIFSYVVLVLGLRQDHGAFLERPPDEDLGWGSLILLGDGPKPVVLQSPAFRERTVGFDRDAVMITKIEKPLIEPERG